jgi:hypothetical protein
MQAIWYLRTRARRTVVIRDTDDLDSPEARTPPNPNRQVEMCCKEKSIVKTLARCLMLRKPGREGRKSAVELTR